MWSADRYPHLNKDIVDNVMMKVRHFLGWPSDERQLTVFVYGDNEPISSRMWHNIFHEDVNFMYTTEINAIPIPDDYQAEHYGAFMTELQECVAHCIGYTSLAMDVLYGLYNVSAGGEQPRVHLALLNRRVKRSEFRVRVESDNTSRQSSQSSLEELGRTSSGESSSGASGTARRRELARTMSSPRLSSGRVSLGEVDRVRSVERSGGGGPIRVGNRGYLKGLSGTDSGVTSASESTERSSKECSVGAAASSPNLTSDINTVAFHDDPRFISIDTLRRLVSDLLELDFLSPTSPVSTGSSSSTSIGERIRQFALAFERGRTGASADGTRSSTETLAESSTKSSTESRSAEDDDDAEL